jgi:serine/threonine-protein kinase
VITVYRVGAVDDQVFVAMELVDGGTLRSWARGRNQHEILAAYIAAGSGLAAAHAAGVVHRDVKPDNVLIDDKGNVKLCDLGFAVPIPRHAASTAKAALAVGTVGYMSPETLKGKPDVKVGADIYSLGIHLYALLTGHEPYTGASSQEVVTDQIESGMPVPNLMVVNAPPGVIQLLKKMMHPDPDRRFASVADVIAALDHLAT